MKNLTFKDLIGKYKALPAKTKNLIMVVLGIAIFLGAYMLGFQKLNESTAAIQTDIDTQAAYVNQLKDYYNNLNQYQNGIANAKQEINANLKRLPFGLKSEDLLMYVKIMNEQVGGDLSNVNFSTDNFIGEFGCTIDDKAVNAQAMGSSINFTTTLNYEQFKDMLKYIYEDTQEITFVDTVNLSYYSADLNLNASFQINKYYIEYDGSTYVPVYPIPDVPLGVTDPFGTVN